MSEGLPSGATLSKSNTRMVALPRDTVPDRVVGREALGEQLAAPVTRGSPVTTVQLVKGIEARPGHVIAPVSLADESVVQVLHVGQVVDVHAVDQMGGRLVASEARVAALPGPDEGGMLSNNSRQPVLLEVRASEAAQVLTSSSGVMVILR